jgi:predicted RNA binding protein YcfA (HicA-like mRNA interferase family)
MGERIRQMSAAEVERILQRYGFALISQKGSHRALVPSDGMSTMSSRYGLASISNIK